MRELPLGMNLTLSACHFKYIPFATKKDILKPVTTTTNNLYKKKKNTTDFIRRVPDPLSPPHDLSKLYLWIILDFFL